MKKTFTIEEIKEAYWKTYHKSGEWCFDYISGSESECERSTIGNFQDFMENLYPSASYKELDDLVERLVQGKPPIKEVLAELKGFEVPWADKVWNKKV